MVQTLLLLSNQSVLERHFVALIELGALSLLAEKFMVVLTQNIFLLFKLSAALILLEIEALSQIIEVVPRELTQHLDLLF